MNPFIFGTLAQIPRTLAVVSECWAFAENDLQARISRNHPGANEELITSLFHGEFADRLRKASQQGEIENAFLVDLMSSFPDVPDYELWKIAHGLVADITVHNRQAERETGGDLGLMIIRPCVEKRDNLIKIGDYRRGILCQAKLRDKKGNWGHFTKKQKQVLPERLAYLCLLLYSYTDIGRRHLQSFHWYIPLEETIEQLAGYMKAGSFPSLVSSDYIIQAIGQGVIGTDNDDVLDRIVSPTRNPSLIITISWPDGRHPGLLVYVTVSGEEYLGRQIRQRASN